jgi:hypothetical protein
MSLSLLQKAESIELYIEDEAFLRSYDLAPPPPLSRLPISKMSLFLNLPVRRRSRILTGEGGGAVSGAKSYDLENAWSAIESFNTLWQKVMRMGRITDSWTHFLSS